MDFILFSFPVKEQKYECTGQQNNDNDNDYNYDNGGVVFVSGAIVVARITGGVGNGGVVRVVRIRSACGKLLPCGDSLTYRNGCIGDLGTVLAKQEKAVGEYV